jgi:hypothetical protein
MILGLSWGTHQVLGNMLIMHYEHGGNIKIQKTQNPTSLLPILLLILSLFLKGVNLGVSNALFPKLIIPTMNMVTYQRC